MEYTFKQGQPVQVNLTPIKLHHHKAKQEAMQRSNVQDLREVVIRTGFSIKHTVKQIVQAKEPG